MRTIVAFLISTVAFAQGPTEIERLQKRLADHPDNIAEHQALLRALSNPVPLPIEKVRAERRAQVLWLIQHDPESKFFDNPFAQLWPRGRLGDPDGFAQAAELWQDQASKPGASAKTIANAALFFKVADPAQSFAILDAARESHPDDPDLARARGILHASAMLGVSGIDDANAMRFTTSGASRATPAAARAREEIQSSTDAHLVGGAGDFLSRGGSLIVPYDVTFGDDDVPSFAERLLRRARELAPLNDEWNTALGTALRTKAQRTNDPHEKLRLLTESYNLVPDAAKPGFRPEMVSAEFAAGDDTAAERDARGMVDNPLNPNEYNLGQTILGRLAIARGNTAEARDHLLASLKPPAKFKNPIFEPNMTLAQDLYEAGDRASVLAYLEGSRAVWKFDRGRIDRMISFVKKSPSADLLQLSRQFPGSEVLRHPAPAFQAQDPDGNTWTREQLTGKVVALEFGSAPLAEKVSKDFAPRGAVLLQVQDDDTKRRFEVLTDPTLVVIDRQGNVSGFRSGQSTEAEWRNEFESGFGRGTNPALLPPPIPREPVAGVGGTTTLSWEPIENAESYIVEWDSRSERGWIYDADHTVRVIPTRDTSAILDLTGFTRLRWRVYAVPKNGAPGETSAWHELDGASVTKIYK